MTRSISFGMIWAAVLIAAAQSLGATGTWREPGGGDWVETANWDGSIPKAPGDAANFDSTYPVNNGSITLNEPVTVGVIDFANPHQITIGSGNPITFDATDNSTAKINVHPGGASIRFISPIQIAEGDNLSIDVASGGSVELFGSLSGTPGHLTKSGNGVLNLAAGSNLWQGSVTLNSGRLVVDHEYGLGDPNVATYVHGGLLELNRFSTETVHLLGGTLSTNPNGSSVHLAGGVVLSDGLTGTVSAPVYKELYLEGGVTGSGDLLFDTDGRVNIRYGALDHRGGLTVQGPGSVAIRTANTYSGVTDVAGRLFIYHSGALGAASGADQDATIVHPEGRLWLANDLLLDHEKVILNGGRIGAESGGVSYITAPIEVTAPSTFGDGRWNWGTLVVAAPIHGEHDVTFDSGTTVLTSANSFSGRVTIDGGRLEVAHPDALGGARVLEMHKGSFAANAPVSVTFSHPLRNGSMIGGSNLLNVGNPELLTQSAVIDFSDNGGLQGPTTIRQSEFGETLLINVNGTSPIDLIVQRGVVGFAESRVPDVYAAVSVANADAIVQVEGTLDADLHLNGATGFGYLGGLIGQGTVSGDIDLGPEGAVVGVRTINGAIHGGDFMVSSGMNITGGGHTFNGKTMVGLNVHNPQGGSEGGMILLDHGRLAETNQVVVGNRSGLTIDKRGEVNLGDSLADSVPIALRGGRLRFTPNLEAPSFELVGEVTLERGHSYVELTEGGEALGELVISRLMRQPGSTMKLVLGRFAPRNETQLHFGSPPPLEHGLIGGWATIESKQVDYFHDFATYDPLLGYTELGVASRPSQVEGASVADNVLLTAPQSALTTDVSVNSLVNSRQQAIMLDLGGNTLNVGSGGIIFNSAPNSVDMGISNGQITAGGTDGPNQLILWAHTFSNDVDISARISDHGERSVDVVKAGDKTIALSGENTYSGATIVNDGELLIMEPSALPEGTDLRVDGGALRFRYESDETLRLGSVTIRDGGNLGLVCCSPDPPQIRAESYSVESGYLGQPMAGWGPLVKDTVGRFDIRHDRRDYRGSVTINDGTMVVGRENDTGALWPLGTGRVTISGGTLVNQNPNIPNNITLAGGAIATASSDKPRTFSGNVNVTADSTLYTFDGLYTPVRFDPSSPTQRGFGRGPEARDLVFDGPMTLADHITLDVIGTGDLHLSSLSVGAASTIYAEQGTVSIAGPLRSNHANASLQIAGNGEVEFHGSFAIERDQSLTITVDGTQPVMRIEGDQRGLTGVGTFVNGVELLGGARLQPGYGVGGLTVQDSIVFGAGAIFEVELNDALGTAGGELGWDLVASDTTIQLAATEQQRLTVELVGLDTEGSPGQVARFDPQRGYQWLIGSAPSIEGFQSSLTHVNASGFVEHNPIADLGQFSLQQSDESLLLVYNPEGLSGAPLLAGDANQDYAFDQLDLVQVQIAAKYLTGEPATWGEGDWNGAPGGSAGSPPTGDGLFNQLDIVAAQLGGVYLTGPYAATRPDGQVQDGQTSVVYNVLTGELAVDAPHSTELTSINIDSATGIFTREAAANLGGSFDNDADGNIFKATFGSSFGTLSFGNVAQSGLSEDFVLNDLSVIGSLAGGGDLGEVDLVYVPEPTSALLLVFGIGLVCFRRVDRDR